MHKAEPSLPQLANDHRERFGGLRAIAIGIVRVAVMQQHDRSRTNTFSHSLGDHVGAGPVGVPDAQRPADGLLAELTRDAIDPGTAEAVRRTEVQGTLPGRIAYGPGSELHIETRVRRAAKIQFAMMVSVAPDGVTFLRHAPRDRGPALHMSAKEEEGRRHVELAEYVEDARSRRRIRSIVKGERDRLTLGIRQTANHPTEHRAVAMQRAMDRRRYTDARGDENAHHPNSGVMRRRRWCRSARR